MDTNIPVSREKAKVVPLSQIIIQNHDIVTFAKLMEVVNLYLQLIIIYFV